MECCIFMRRFANALQGAVSYSLGLYFISTSANGSVVEPKPFDLQQVSMSGNNIEVSTVRAALMVDATIFLTALTQEPPMSNWL
jgi:hypothetical protein